MVLMLKVFLGNLGYVGPSSDQLGRFSDSRLTRHAEKESLL